jgi:7,8-dihydropterin-6-yl-methyl-4-(beta-D-ribofuranosyl)aminobenzene 5'-phosphate synthase
MTAIQILCDNSISGNKFLGEHGFSAFIEREDGRYLFDTGQGSTLAYNAEQADVRLDGIQAIFLSHGHYDHTGGLAWVLTQTGPVKVVAHEAVFAPHTGLGPGDPPASRYIGCPRSRETLESAGARFEFHQTTFEFAPGLWFVTGFDRNPGQTPDEKRLVLPVDGGYVTDPIADDACLLLDTDSGPVLVLGCAHGGVLNILDHLAAELGVSRLHGIFGGTHLISAGVDQIQAVIDKLEAFAVRQVGVSHCTGNKAAVILARHFGDRFCHAAAGSRFTFS